MAELRGSLGGLGLSAVLQLLADLHHSGDLELTATGSHAVLGFDDGRLVAASYNDDVTGLDGLAACARELTEGEFVFVEGEPSGERTLDLGGRELQTVLGGFLPGDAVAERREPPGLNTDEAAPTETCPFLAFVDDTTRHYARPTALHRCYAGGTPALVTGHEQRELCLSQRYPTCPRFRNAAIPSAVGTPPAADSAALAAASPSLQAIASRGLAPGVAGTEMQVSNAGPNTGEAAPSPQREYEPTAPRHGRFSLRSPRRLLLVGGPVGLVVLVGGALLVAAILTGGFAQNPPTIVGQLPPASTVPRAVSSVTGPNAAPASQAKPAPASSPLPQAAISSAPSAPAAVPAPTSPGAAAPPVASAVPAPATVAVPGQPLVDVRFAAGPQPGWLENPPYATWSDGAYRLQAAQPTHFVAVGAPIQSPPDDVVVSATFRKTGGPPGGGYGLIVRNQSADPLNGVNQNGRLYVMEAGDQGEYGVWRRDGERWLDVVPWTRSESVRPDSSANDLEVRAVGSQLTFSVNGARLVTVQDDALPSGGVGVFVGGDDNDVAVDRFVVRVPD